MAHQPDPRLAAHNARVLRLARDYDKKYRPVLIPIAKHMNLETGDSFPRIQLIMRESAQYTDNRKPLSRASVFRLLAEMADAGALKTETRFGPTGRQRSSYRYLDVHAAIRFGKPVEHLWDAPLPEDETPGETPHETPDETPITLSISHKNSPSNSVRTGEKGASPSREIERGPGAARPDRDVARDDPARARDTGRPVQDRAQRDADTRARSSGICNTFIAWEVKGTGKKVAFRKDNPPRQKPPKSARVVELSPAEASFMFRCLDRNQWPAFILDPPYRRASMMSALRDRDGKDRAERDARPDAASLARQEEDKRAAERAERAPLVARLAELAGQTVEDVRARVERTGMSHSTMMTGLKTRIFRAERGLDPWGSLLSGARAARPA